MALDVMLTESRSHDADLLVLGITGDSLLPTGAGTLATKCLRKAGTKVMLVHAGHAQPFRRIVACVDFSDSSREVMAQACRVAGRDRAEVHLLHVFQPVWNFWASMTEGSALAYFEKGYRAILEGNLRHVAAESPLASPRAPANTGPMIASAMAGTSRSGARSAGAGGR